MMRSDVHNEDQGDAAFAARFENSEWEDGKVVCVFLQTKTT